MNSTEKSGWIVLAISACAIMSGFTFLSLLAGPSPIIREKNLPRVDWLPAEAHDITFAKRTGFGWFTCYEYSISRVGFEELAKREGWQFEEKKDVSLNLRSILELSPLKYISGEGYDVVDLALYYSNLNSNGGGIIVAYDLNRERLFVHQSHR
jgi:hypothetical protein